MVGIYFVSQGLSIYVEMVLLREAGKLVRRLPKCDSALDRLEARLSGSLPGSLRVLSTVRLHRRLGLMSRLELYEPRDDAGGRDGDGDGDGEAGLIAAPRSDFSFGVYCADREEDLAKVGAKPTGQRIVRLVAVVVAAAAAAAAVLAVAVVAVAAVVVAAATAASAVFVVVAKRRVTSQMGRVLANCLDWSEQQAFFLFPGHMAPMLRLFLTSSHWRLPRLSPSLIRVEQ